MLCVVERARFSQEYAVIPPALTQAGCKPFRPKGSQQIRKESQILLGCQKLVAVYLILLVG